MLFFWPAPLPPPSGQEGGREGYAAGQGGWTSEASRPADQTPAPRHPPPCLLLHCNALLYPDTVSDPGPYAFIIYAGSSAAPRPIFNQALSTTLACSDRSLACMRSSVFLYSSNVALPLEFLPSFPPDVAACYCCLALLLMLAPVAAILCMQNL